MTTTTDEVTHLRALLAEQTARAERAETLLERAEVAFHAAIARANQALAANAEMRAALEHANEMEAFVCDTPDTVEHESGETEEEPCGECIDCRARALLSRPALGAGMVVVPREVVERWRHVVVGTIESMKPTWSNSNVAILLRQVQHDLDALIKQGGG